MFSACGAVAAAWLLSTATTSRAPSLDLESFTLPNGLEVLVNVQPENPTVHLEVTYRVGSRHDPRGKEGLAHLLEHIMYSGTRHIRDGQLAPLLERAGARIDAATTPDFTTFSTTLPASELELALWVESSRMGFLLGRMGLGYVVEREKASIARERRWALGPETQLVTAALAQLYPARHPYRHPPAGAPDGLAAVTVDDVRQFYYRHFAPNQATLVLSGGLSARNAKALVEKYFGPLVRGPEPEAGTDHLGIPRAGQPSTVTVATSDEETRILVVWPSVAAFSDEEPALEVLAWVLAGGPGARLEKALAGPPPRALHTMARQVGLEANGRFEMSLTLARGQDPDGVLKVALGVIDGLEKVAPDEAEIAAARSRCRREKLVELENPRGLARHLARRQLLLGTPDGFAEGLLRLDDVDPAAVARAAKNVLGRDRVVVIARPDRTAASQAQRPRWAANPAALERKAQ